MAKKSSFKRPVLGTVRVDSKNLMPYRFTRSGWRKSDASKIGDDFKRIYDNLLHIVKLFVACNNFDVLVDKKNPRFLKGQYSVNGIAQGARINVLPDGSVLEKAFSLFAPYLKIHDQTSHDHWDVIYKNKGGTWSYVYTLAKRKKHMNRKYRKVDEFDRVYHKLRINVRRSLIDENDTMAVPMYTLLKTYMRVGNEIYLKAHGHKGLTTLTKKDISIDGNVVTFNYLGKGGVPITISQKFPDIYVKRLKKVLGVCKGNKPVFSKSGGFLCDRDFKSAFVRYCGKEFYPHIVRSHYATMKVKKFLCHRKKLSKDEVRNLFMLIAHDLGHKKFDKKKGEWKEHYVVTVNSYIRPKLVEKVNRLLVN